MKISVECNAFDVNEDKQRQCYKQLKCFWPKCRYSCKQSSHLNEHISHHLNKRQFVCNECNKQFNHNSHLIQHKRSGHSNDRPFVCNGINCNKRFKIKSNLMLHLLRHPSVKSFGCNKCDKRFKYKSTLILHKSCHSNERQFKCDFKNCKKKFNYKSNLYHHKQRNHIGIKKHIVFIIIATKVSSLCLNLTYTLVTNIRLKDHLNVIFIIVI